MSAPIATHGREVPGDGAVLATPAPWLRRIGRVLVALLAIWLAFVSLIPPNIYGLVSLVLIFPVWGAAVVLGLWHLVKTPGQRLYALGMIVALPTAILLSSTLYDHLPLVKGKAGVWCFYAVLAAFPAVLLGRWLGRVTAPPTDTQRSALPTKILLGAVAVVLCFSVLLVALLLGGADESAAGPFVRAYYYPSLIVAGVLGFALAVIGIPYAFLGLVRRTRHIGAMLLIITGLVLAALLLGGIWFILMLGMYG